MIRNRIKKTHAISHCTMTIFWLRYEDLPDSGPGAEFNNATSLYSRAARVNFSCPCTLNNLN